MTTTITLDDETRQALQTALLVWMQAISEDRWCAGWGLGLEHILWLEDDEEARQLRVLARTCGGWWIWDKAPVFVPLAQWEKQMRGDGV